MGTINKRINTRWLVIDEETGYKSNKEPRTQKIRQPRMEQRVW
jgi:hypothetical protein